MDAQSAKMMDGLVLVSNRVVAKSKDLIIGDLTLIHII